MNNKEYMSDIVLLDYGLTESDLDKIAAEDARQIDKWGQQKHTPSEWYVILGEEFGELGKAILEGDQGDVVNEGIQVATLALKIASMTERNDIEGQLIERELGLRDRGEWDDKAQKGDS